MIRKTLYEWCKENKKEYLLDEWDKERNKITPKDISYGSKTKVFWICVKKHSYLQSSNDKTNHERGCPYCANVKVLPGYNDFEAWCKNNENFQFLLNEWDYEKNSIKPYEIMPKSDKKDINWICPKNHKYQTSVHNRTRPDRPAKCPYCTHKIILKGINDLEGWCNNQNKQKLLEEYDYENNLYKPCDLFCNSNKIVWWIGACGHKWKASINNRVKNNTGCPYCTNQMVLSGYNDFETWCKNNNFSYLLEEWDYEKNQIKPDEITPKTKRKVYWKCKNNHSYSSSINGRVLQYHGCTECSKYKRVSRNEKLIFFYCKKYFNDSKENEKPQWLGKQELDIYIPSINVAIEYDGSYWHKDDYAIDRDLKKNKICNENNVTLIRIRELGCPPINDCIVFEIDKTNAENINKVIKNLLKYLKVHEPEVDYKKDIKQIILEMKSKNQTDDDY